MNRMLINATHKDEELRIGLANGQYLYDLIIESSSRGQKQSNIYKGKVTRIEPSLEAAFVDYGEERHGFLPLKEVARSCFRKGYQDSGKRPSISEVLEEGQELIIQVEKEERGNKGAALTTFISLPGCYLVLMPNNPRAGGVSRRIEGEERDELHDILSNLELPDGMGIIVRTAGGGRSQEELQWDLEILLRLWEVIQTASTKQQGPFLIYQEGNAVIRALRDYLRKDIDEIIVDHEDVYNDVINHLKMIRPDFVSRVKLYSDPTPLFTRFQIESQIESAFQREVRLPSGGSVIIDLTEAMVSIDINSAKSTKGGDIEETALMTNLEAANEIARQMRLRDIGGLIVIDFIDMTPIRNQREVEDCLRKALSMDRARVQIGRISRFGLLEMSRQRLRPSLGDSSRVTCPRCTGQGTIRGIESLGLSVIRIIEEEALKDNTAQVRAVLPTEIAAYLLNEKRQAVIDIEKRQDVNVIVVPSSHLLTPQYEVERIRNSDVNENDDKASYTYTTMPESATQTTSTIQQKSQQPAVKHLKIEDIPTPKPAPKAKTSKGQPGFLKKLYTFIFEKKEQAGTSGSSGKDKTTGGRGGGGGRGRTGGRRRTSGSGNRRQQTRGRGNSSNRSRDNYRQSGKGNRQRQDNRTRSDRTESKPDKRNSRQQGNKHSSNQQRVEKDNTNKNTQPVTDINKQVAKPVETTVSTKPAQTKETTKPQVVDSKPRVVEEKQQPIAIEQERPQTISEQTKVAGSDVTPVASVSEQPQTPKRQRHYHTRRRHRQHGNRKPSKPRTAKRQAQNQSDSKSNQEQE